MLGCMAMVLCCICFGAYNAQAEARVQAKPQIETATPTAVRVQANPQTLQSPQNYRLAIERTEEYLHIIKGKKVGIVVNQTSVFEYKHVHLADSLLALGVEVVRIFSPEHGLRAEAEAGAKVESGKDIKTGLEVVSLYGSHKKPTPNDLEGIDVIIFDIQDVGVRFYTYISTLHYVMEACAQANINLIVLDRPNPHIGAVDGPILDTSCCGSFIGMHPIPILHGLTIGEYARMINGEGWLIGGIQCSLSVVKMEAYTRQTPYNVVIPPSPNLPTAKAVCVYPSLCLFEGTNISLGRGTSEPFTCYGFAGSTVGDFVFTPVSIPGKAANPLYMNKECRGFKVDCLFEPATTDLSANDASANDMSVNKLSVNKLSNTFCSSLYINLEPLITMYKAYPDKSTFFIPFFKKLAGTTELEKQIKEGKTGAEIRQSWQEGLKKYREMSQKYYLYL